MAKKKIKDLTLFVSGNPNNDFPTKIMMGYKVQKGGASKRTKMYEYADPDPKAKLSDVWEEIVSDIKELEGAE